MRALDVAARTLLAAAAGVGLISIYSLAAAPALAGLTLAIVTAIRPPTGLLIFAALAPLGAPIAALLQAPVSMTEALAVAFLTGAALHGMVGRGSPARGFPFSPFFLALTVLASYLVELSVRRAVIGPGPMREELHRLVTGAYFLGQLDLGALPAAALLLEGLGLLIAVRAAVGAHRDRLLGLARMMAAGGAGAAAMSLVRVASIAFASGDFWHALPAVARDVRVSPLMPDVNAAGSYFALVTCLAAGLVAASRGAARAGWLLAAGLAASALWLTSSRAAVLATLLLAAIAVVGPIVAARRPRLSSRAIAAGAALAVAAALVVAFLPNRVTAAGPAIEIRRDLAIVAFRLTAEHPAFGVGVGQFYQASGDEIQKLPVRRYYSRENAHNTFLQVLAELGCAGMIAFLATLAWPGRGALSILSWDVAEERRVGMAAGAGVAAFLLSAVLGHPLLVTEPAIAFWTLAGAVSSFAVPRPFGSLQRLLGFALIVILAVSVPFRARSAVADANLEHLGYGLSLWKTSDDGERYRLALGAATVFAPTDAAVVEVPLRLDRDSGRPVMLDVRIRGILVARLQLTASEWLRYRLQIPEREHARFIPLELDLGEHATVGLRVGKVTRVAPRRR